MYRGTRDPMIGIAVQQAFCNEFTDSAGTVWVEIFVPPASPMIYDKPWPSIVVPPNQVFCVSDYYNEFFVNRGALLSLYYKDAPDANGHRAILSRETNISEDVQARFLVHEQFIRTGQILDCARVRQNFEASGFTMAAYMARMV